MHVYSYAPTEVQLKLLFIAQLKILNVRTARKLYEHLTAKLHDNVQLSVNY